MEQGKEVIPIFFTVDDKYIPFLAVAIQSLIENSTEKYYYLIKILYTDITEENKKKKLSHGDYINALSALEYVNFVEELD